MDDLRILPVTNEELVLNVATMADEIWHEYFASLLSPEQIDYMLDKFLSFDALLKQIADGYEYFLLISDYTFVGFFGIHEEEKRLFLSKLYIHQDFRGKKFASAAFKNLIDLCRLREIDTIWLTCNRQNADTLAVYRHFGFVKTKEQVTDIGSGYVMDDYVLEYQIR